MRFLFPKLLLPLFVMIVAPLVLFAGVTTGADFLKIPRSARAIALGESYTAVLDDPTAIDYNPAALNTIKNIAASMMYQSWIDNTYGLYLSGAYRLSDFVLGGSVYWFNYNGLPEYDYSGNQVAQYNPSDLNVKIAASLDAGVFLDALQGMSIGVGLSLINRNLLTESKFGFTVDTGVNYKTTLGKLVNSQDDFFNLQFGKLPINAGFVIQNLGYAVEDITPIRFTGGLSFGLLPDLILSLDLTKDILDTPWMFKMGAEYTLFEILSLRAGFNLGRDVGKVALGLGLKYPMNFNTIRFDYAFVPLDSSGILGNSHNFSLYAEFKFEIRAEDYYTKGVYYFSKKDYLNTRDMWKKAVEMEPRNELYRNRYDQIVDIIKVNEIETAGTTASNKAITLENMIIRDLYGDKRGAVANGSKVTFFYRSINRLISSVAVTGDMNGWNTNGIPMVRDNDGWTVTIEMQPGRRQYKYIIDKSYFILDPANPDTVPDGQGGKNSVILVPDVGQSGKTNRTMGAETNKAIVTNSVSDTNQPMLTNAITNQVTNIPPNPITNSTRMVTNIVTNKIKTNLPPDQKIIYTNMNIKSTNQQKDVKTKPVKPNRLKPTTATIKKKLINRPKPKSSKKKPDPTGYSW